MNVFQIVTDRIVQALAKGVIPWTRPWRVNSVPPTNLVSGKAYRGVNIFLLGFTKFTSPYWASKKQINDLGGRIKGGEKASIAVFWKVGVRDVKDETTGEITKKKSFMLRYYNVWNSEQCEGIKSKRLNAWIAKGIAQPLPVEDREEKAREIVAAYVGRANQGPALREGANAFDAERAAYSPFLDEINMPGRERFVSVDGYYGTLFHEIGHSTGHKSRIGRPSFVKGFGAEFGSPEYAREELVAELCSAFLMHESGLDVQIENTSAYIQNWMRALSSDPKLIVFAAGQAQKAAEWVMGERSVKVEVEGDAVEATDESNVAGNESEVAA